MKNKITTILLITTILFSTNLNAQWSNPNNVTGNFTINGGYLNLGDFASDPSGIPDGTMWYNTVSNTIKIKQGGVVSEIGSGGGGGMAIGDPVTSCTANSVPYCDASGNLAQANPALTYNEGSLILTVPNFQAAGNSTFGDATSDTVDSIATAWSFPADTTFSCAGGVNGLNIDSNTMSIDCTNNRVGFNNDAPTFTADVTGTIRSKVGGDIAGLISAPATGDTFYTTGDSGSGVVGAVRWNVNSAYNPTLYLYGAHGTASSVTTAVNNDPISAIQFAGKGASAWNGGPMIIAETTEDWSGAGRGSRLEIRWAAPGSTMSSSNNVDFGLPASYGGCTATAALISGSTTCVRSTVSISTGSSTDNLVESKRFVANAWSTPGSASLPEFLSLTDTDTGMYFPAAGETAWSANSTQTMRIDASGNVCIGTDTTPDAKLDVEGTLRVDDTSDLRGAISNGGSGTCSGLAPGSVCVSDSLTSASTLTVVGGGILNYESLDVRGTNGAFNGGAGNGGAFYINDAVRMTGELYLLTSTTIPAGDCDSDAEVGRLRRYSKDANNITLCGCQKVGSAFGWAAVITGGDCT